MANWWDSAPLAEPAKTPAAAGNWWDAAPLAQPSEASSGFQNPVQVSQGQSAPTRVSMDMTKADRGAVDALARGAASGLTANFYDELRGLVEAGGAKEQDPASLFGLIQGIYQKSTGGAGADERYSTAVTRERALTKTAEEQHPVASIAGNVAGAVALPVGGALSGATTAGRVLGSAAVGAGYGGLAGAGEGDGALDRLSRAGTGAAVGGVLGGAIVPAIAGAEALGRGIAKVASPVTQAFRGVRDTETEAARRILDARSRDAKTANPGLQQPEVAAAQSRGQPVANVDEGGAAILSLARSSANTSTEGRAALEALSSDRYATQSPRTVSFLKSNFDYPDSTATIDRLHATAKLQNRPAYAKAYSEGQAIWDEGLEQLVQAPVVQQAIRLAFVTGRNKAALDGFGPIKNPFVLNKETGALELMPGAIPNLQFWDHVKRNLDKVGGGEGPAFARALRDHLDEIVPSYKDARAGAAKFFGAEDALEAGAKFATMGGQDALKIGDARKALAALKPADRKLFETGFVSNLIAKVESLRDGQDVVKNIFNSEYARKQIQLALGKERADSLEAFLLTERAMDQLRGALGNSSTARQVYELGMAGAKNPVTIAGLVGGASSYGSGSVGPGDAFAAGLAFAARKGQIKIDERIAKRVGEMLASDNPRVLEQAYKIVARSENFRRALLNFTAPGARISGEQAGGVPALQAAGVGRADDQPDVPRPPGQ